MGQTHPVEKVVIHNLTRTGASLSFLFASITHTSSPQVPHNPSPLSFEHSKCTGRSKHPTYDSIHPRVLRIKIVVKLKKERSCQEMKARSLRALLLASSLILSVGTTSMPIMAVDIAPDTSDSGISIDADDGGNDLFIAGSNTIKPVS